MRSVPLPFLSKITLLWTLAREPGPVSPVNVDSFLPFSWTHRGEIYSRRKRRLWRPCQEASRLDSYSVAEFFPSGKAPVYFTLTKLEQILYAILFS